MKASKEFIAKQNKLCLTPKTQTEYERILGRLNSELVKKMGKIVGIIEEEMNLSEDIINFSLYIPHEKFISENITLSDTEKILDKFCNDAQYAVLPKLPKEQEGGYFVIYPPVEDPFSDNFNNFRKMVTKITQQGIDTGKDAKKTLYLSANGDLWKEPKKKYCYRMTENSNKHKIVKLLADYKGEYVKTEIISKTLNGKKAKLVRGDIAKIKRKIKNNLSISNVIEGRPVSGYRINPKYRIIILKSE